MIHRVLYIGRWIVDFLFAEHQYDIEEVLSYLDFVEASDIAVDSAVSLMKEQRPNTGFTFADTEYTYMLVVCGPSSSGKEYINTIVHEIHHLAVIISKSLGVDLRSETPAYLAGDSVRALAEVLCHFGCKNCNSGKSEADKQ